MWILRAILVALAVLPFIEAKSMGLEDLMSALSSKSEDDSQDESQESPVSDEQLLQFAKRSGLMSDPQPSSNTDNPVNLATALQALQALKRQQSLQVYSADYAQPVSGASAVPQRSARAVSNTLPVYDTDNYQPKTTSKSSSQYSSQPSSYSSYNTGSQQPQTAYSDSKSSVKDDRQGHYGYEGHGYEPAASYSRSPVDHYAAHHQPEPYSKVALPIPSVSIKFDPLGLLKLLLQGIPRPLFNLNGKIFLGLELGKNVGLGIGKGVPHSAPHAGHYGNNERVITIG